jgi:hypothetical protein
MVDMPGFGNWYGFGFLAENSNVYLVRPPRGWWLHRGQGWRLAVMPTGRLRILNSLQTVMICRSIVITLTESGGASKQCQQPLTPPPILKLGLLLFLIVLNSS